MSCYIVGTETIDRILTHVLDAQSLRHYRMTAPVGTENNDLADVDALGSALYELNRDSFNTYYEGSERVPQVQAEDVPCYVFRRDSCVPAVALQEVSRLLYQCDSAPDNAPNNALQKWLAGIQDRLLWDIVRRSHEWRHSCEE